MKKVITIFVLLISLQNSAQQKDSLPKTKFDLGYTYSPDYSYRILSVNASEQWMKENYDTLEVPKFGYTTGVNLAYHINHYLFLSSGVLFSDKGERTPDYVDKPINNYVNHNYYLDIPLKVNYYLGHHFLIKKEKPFKPFVSAGLSINVHVKSKTIVQGEQTGEVYKLKQETDLSPLNLAFVAGLGFDHKINHRWYFKIEPSYRISITSISKTSMKKYFYSIGLNVGLFYKF